MAEASITAKAYAKILFHAAKYPHLAVNGLLLAEKNSKSKFPTIADSIPLFHQCLYVTPMAEIALIKVNTEQSMMCFIFVNELKNKLTPFNF